MRATTAPDNGKITFENSVCKIDDGCFVFFVAGMAIKLQKTLKARGHFVRLGNRILVRIKIVLISKVEDIDNIRSACFNNVFGEVKISFFAGYAVKADDRFENGASV